MQTNKNQTGAIPLKVIVVFITFIVGALSGIYIFKIRPAMQLQSLARDIAATYLPDGRPITGVRLVDQDKKVFDETRFKGKWNFMYFGYTQCPDVCPTTLLVMKSVWGKLPEEARQEPQPQMIMVSVDPDRDTPEKLGKYVKFYNPEFVGVTGKNDDLDILTRQVGALYGYEDVANGEGYTVNHSGQIILVDPEGKMRAVFSPPFRVDEIVKTFVSIRKYYNLKKNS